VNELLRRFLLQAGLREDDVAARLGVDPKTVRRWLNGRVPYPHNRAAIADLLGAEEADLWPGASGTLTARIRPDELLMAYPHHLAVLRGVRLRFFSPP
jgi:transcriptional regulator with XRE-family HTH domain